MDPWTLVLTRLAGAFPVLAFLNLTLDGTHGLEQPWHGSAFLNPTLGSRHGFEQQWR